MTVATGSGGVIVLEGSCSSEDAEALLRQLRMGGATVDLRSCESAHTAVIQVLLACKPALLGPPPESAFWCRVYPWLASHK